MTFSAATYFNPEVRGLRRRTLSGGIATAAGQMVTFGLHFASIALLARWLAPTDFGLVAMVTAVTGFVQLFGDSGLSAATVQRASITHEQVSALFWINAGLGLLLMLATTALAPLLAWLYGEPRLAWITAGVSVGFLFRGLGVQHGALLRRNLDFSRLMVATVGGAALGYTIGVAAAIGGLGCWALVWQSTATAAGTTVALWIACRWRPGRPRREAGVNDLVKFGGALTGSTLLIYLLRNFDNLLVGWYWGAAPLGFYSRGYAVMMLPMSQLNGPLNQVAMPALSRVQSEPARFKEAYFQGVMLLAGISLPTCVCLVACAEPFILTVLGEKWRDITTLFIALAPAAVLSTITGAAGWVYHALGLARRQLQWTLMAVPVYLAGFAVALPFGVTAVAASFSLLLTLLFLPTFWFAFRGTPLRVRDLLGVLWRPSATALMGGTIAWLLLQTAAVTAFSPPVQLLIGALAFTASYAMSWAAIPGGRAQLIGTWRYLARALTRNDSIPRTNPTLPSALSPS